MDYGIASGAGEDARGVGGVGPVYATGRQAGVKAESAGAFQHGRCVACVRGACDSAAAAVCAWLSVDWLRAVYLAAARCERCSLGALGRAQGGVRHSHRGGEVGATWASTLGTRGWKRGIP